MSEKKVKKCKKK